MSEQDKNDKKVLDEATAQIVKSFVKGLNEEQRMLIVLKSQLYGGSWQPMLDDLRNRLEGKPYIFKLANRIQDDIVRIQRMSEFENKYNVNLADYVDSV